jgi:putative transposase
MLTGFILSAIIAKHIDGPLFRGRYKPILVSHDEYFLQVSRYIHRNPIETKLPLVERLYDYLWSSYPNDMDQKAPFEWLELSLTRELLGTDIVPVAAYREFVMQGNDEQTVEFHKKGKIGAVFGCDLFKSWVFDDLLPQLKNEKKSRVIQPNLTMDAVILVVANFYQVDINTILTSAHGRVKENLPRKVAIHLCQELTGSTMGKIAKVFNLGHYRSVSFITHEVRMRKQKETKLKGQLQAIIKRCL